MPQFPCCCCCAKCAYRFESEYDRATAAWTMPVLTDARCCDAGGEPLNEWIQDSDSPGGCTAHIWLSLTTSCTPGSGCGTISPPCPPSFPCPKDCPPVRIRLPASTGGLLGLQQRERRQMVVLTR